MWEKRELEWEAERLARKKLIEEVIGIQKKQVKITKLLILKKGNALHKYFLCYL